MTDGWREYLIELHSGKDLAYGDAWCRRGEAAGIFPNVARKYDRWIKIRDSHGDTTLEVEPLDDTLADLLIYSVKYLLWLLERYPEAAVVVSGEVPAGSSVAGLLSTVTRMAIVEEPAAMLVSSFEQLEATFVSGSAEQSAPTERVRTVWSLARGAWGELHALPVPGEASASRGEPQLRDVGSLTTTDDLREQLLTAFVEAPGQILLLGFNPTALELRAQLGALGLNAWLLGIAEPGADPDDAVGLLDWSQMSGCKAEFLVVTSDGGKEELLHSFVLATEPGRPLPVVIITGVAHMDFRDPLYAELDAPALVPSYATGHPHTRIHMYQYLHAAASSGLSGAIVEFGSFKGGTTAWLARVAHRLHLDVPIIGFDSWAGFPDRRSLLDMYSHPRCVFTDLDAVRAYLDPLGVELVPGDIYETAADRLRDVPILLAFIDTDNYSPAAAALEALVDNVVPGGAIVFDHFTTMQDYLYTLGERMAGETLLAGRGYFQVHGTGVFVRLPSGGDAPLPQRLQK